MNKEKRKVNLVGQSTLTVSLPTKWVKQNNVEKGDEIYAFFEDNEITFSLTEKKKVNKEICVNIDDFSYFALSRCLSMLYMTNYSKITLIHSKTEILNYKNDEPMDLKFLTRKLLRRFIGAEIILQTDKKTEIECFVAEDTQDLEKIEKRVYFLLKDIFNEMIENIGENYSKFHENVYDYHDNIDKFIYYFLRKLDASDKSNEEKKVAYSFYIFITTLVDNVRHVSERINKYGCNEKTKEYLKLIFEVFIDLFLFIHKGHVVKEVIQKRYDLVKKIDNEKFTVEELEVLSEAMIFLDTINIFSEYSIVKALDEGLIKHK